MHNIGTPELPISIKQARDIFQAEQDAIAAP